MSDVIQFPGPDQGDDVTVIHECAPVVGVYEPARDSFVDIKVNAVHDAGSGFVIAVGPWRLTPLEAVQLTRSIGAAYEFIANCCTTTDTDGGWSAC